jgi:hypothetical protein
MELGTDTGPDPEELDGPTGGGQDLGSRRGDEPVVVPLEPRPTTERVGGPFESEPPDLPPGSWLDPTTGSCTTSNARQPAPVGATLAARATAIGATGRAYTPAIAIGTLNESSLHASLKALFAEEGDELEVDVGSFVADIRRGDLLIEIQTRSFGAMARKLDHLLGTYRIQLVHPVAVETVLHKPGAKPRRSPKRSDLFGLFDELVSMPTLLDHPGLSIEVLLVVVDKVQEPDPTLRRGRGGWRTIDRRLREVRARHRFESIDDLVKLVPSSLPARFTTADLAAAAGTTRDRAQRMVYCLRAGGSLAPVRRTRSGVIYQRR